MIRAAREDDVTALAELNLEVQHLHVAAMPERYREPSRDEVEQHVRELLANRDLAIVVSELDGVPVGYAVVRRIDAPGHTYARPRLTAHVDQIGVRADLHRGGHGRALMSAFAEQARRWGAVAITLDVQTFNAGRDRVLPRDRLRTDDGSIDAAARTVTSPAAQIAGVRGTELPGPNY